MKARLKDVFKNKSINGFTDKQLLSATQSMGVVPNASLPTRVMTITKGIDKLKLVQDGDFVVSLRSFEGGLELSKCEGVISPAYTVLDSVSEISEIYFKYLFKSDGFIAKLNEFKKGIRDGQAIPFTQLKDVFLEAPSTEEQNKIGLMLDSGIKSIDGLLKSLKQKLTHLDEYKTALIHNAVTKGLDAKGCRILDGTPAAEMTWKPSGVEWIGDVPDGWGSGKVKESIYFTCGGEVIDKSHWDEEGDEVLYTASQNPLMSSFKNFPSEKRATKNDVLIARNGNGAIHLPKGGEIFTNVVQKVSINAEYDRKFVAHFLSLAKKYEIAKCYGDIIASLNMEFWSNCPLMKCDMTEQLAILNYLDAQVENIDKAKLTINKKIALLVEYKKSLINEAVSGER